LAATSDGTLAAANAGAGILECLGGVLLLLAVFTRRVAFILSGEMATAYFISD